MDILPNGCKPGNFALRISLKLNYTNNSRPCLNFVDCESFFFNQNSPDILAVCERLSFFRPKGFYYSYAWSHLCQGFPFAWDLSLENSVDSCFRLALLNPVSYFFPFIDHLLRLYEQFLIQFH